MTDKPEIDFIEGPPPTELQITDLIVGDGPEAVTGGLVDVHYVGVEFDTGEQFDSSWDRGEPSSFSLGQVIEGWSQGLAGQTVGSQVLLVVPPALGYGEEEKDSIPPNSTLVFVVDILDAA
jgi:peptidylprolyl isomerase